MQRRKESSSNIWNSCFHYFPGTLRTNIMTSSQLVCQLYKNPNSLSHGVFGTNYKMSTMSARSWRSYGKMEDYEQFIGIRLHAAVFLAPAISKPPTQAFLGELVFQGVWKSRKPESGIGTGMGTGTGTGTGNSNGTGTAMWRGPIQEQGYHLL